MFFNGAMTLSFRNGLLALTLGTLILLTFGYGILAFALVVREGWGAPVGTGSLLQLLLAASPIPIGGTVGFFLVRRAYRKSAAPEAFFFAFFLASLTAEALLLVQAWVNFAALPAFFTTLITRTVWAFRFFGLFLLFFGSLFSFDFAYRKYGNLVGLSALGGLFLAVWVPLRSVSGRNHLLFAVGDAPALVLATVVLALVAAMNYILGARRPGAPDRARYRASAALFFLAAWGAAIALGPLGTWLAAPGVLLAAWKAEQNTMFS